jgi:hypothetical protein
MTRSNRSARAAGSAFESQITGALAKHLPHGEFIERRVTNGAKDRGDIGGVRTRSGERVVVECKNHSRMEIGRWVTEAHFEALNDNAIGGIVVHKRRGTVDPLEQYVTMTLGDLIRIAWGFHE